MMHPEKSSSIEIRELKAQILKRIGSERFKRYSYYVTNLFSLRLPKTNFDRMCCLILGKENMPLHNQLVRSILKKVCSGRAPPPAHGVGPTRTVIASGKNSSTIAEGQGLGGVIHQSQNPPVQIWSNGIVLPPSPRKSRSGVRDRRIQDRPSPLGPNVRADSASNKSTGSEEYGRKPVENGDVIPYDYQRPLEQHHELAEQPDNDDRQTLKGVEIAGSLHRKEPNSSLFVEDVEEIEHGRNSGFGRSLLVAPLGVPFCSASVGGARKPLSGSSAGSFYSPYNRDGVLPDTETLRKRMEQIVAAQGFGAVSTQCADALNKMLDLYLKRLIRSCVDLVGARSGNSITRHHFMKQQTQGRLVNGLRPSNHLHIHSGVGTVEGQRTHDPISLADFKVAMELNPWQLGEDWSLLLEKILMQSFEE